MDYEKYKLGQVSPQDFDRYAKEFAREQQSSGLYGALMSVLMDSEPLMDLVYTYMEHLRTRYERGGGFYGLSFGIGLLVLRSVSALETVPEIDSDDYAKILSPYSNSGKGSVTGTTKLIEYTGLELLKISAVNQGYVEGYKRSQTPPLMPFLGFTALGAIHAHELMHLTSLRG